MLLDVRLKYVLYGFYKYGVIFVIILKLFNNNKVRFEVIREVIFMSV